MNIKTVCVFCGMADGSGEDFTGIAHSLGAKLAERKIKTLYGGSQLGCMGAVADGAISKNGHVIGVLPEALKTREIAHEEITELNIVNSMADRKEVMLKDSDAFIALPGGFGTLDEIFEVLTWNQIGLISKPIALLDHNGYWNDLLKMIDKAKSHQFLREGNDRLLSTHATVDEILSHWGL